MTLALAQSLPSEAEISITAAGIERSFATGKTVNRVLKGISLDIRPGELTLIIGPSGSGKSTLIAVLSGLLRPDAGRVSVLGADLCSLSQSRIDAFRLENCGFVFQGFNLFSSLTAREQVMLPLKYMDVTGDRARKAAEAVLTEVGLGAQMNLRPLELSGGEKQRVAIARALVKRPRLIFADEPTSSLDSENGRIVISLLHKAAQERGATVVAVSHDQRLMTHSDRVVTLEDGEIRRDERQVLTGDFRGGVES